jgi:hypothetical protein
MSYEVFLREDLAALLTALAFTLGMETAQGREAAAERRGAARTLAAIALAVHVAPEPLLAQLQSGPRTIWPELTDRKETPCSPNTCHPQYQTGDS